MTKQMGIYLCFLLSFIKGETFWGCFAQSPNIYSYIFMIFPYQKLGLKNGCFHKCGCLLFFCFAVEHPKKYMDDFRGTLHDLGNLHIPILRWAMVFVNCLVTGNPMISRGSPPQVQTGPAGCCRPRHGQPQPPRKGTTTREHVVPPAALRARHGQRCQGDITWGKAGLLLPFCLGLAMWFYHLRYSCIIIVSCVHTPSHSERERGPTRQDTTAMASVNWGYSPGKWLLVKLVRRKACWQTKMALEAICSWFSNFRGDFFHCQMSLMTIIYYNYIV